MMLVTFQSFFIFKDQKGDFTRQTLAIMLALKRCPFLSKNVLISLEIVSLMRHSFFMSESHFYRICTVIMGTNWLLG